MPFLVKKKGGGTLQQLSDQFIAASENCKDGLNPNTTEPYLASFNSLILCWYEAGWRSVPTRMTCCLWPGQGLGVWGPGPRQGDLNAVCSTDMMTSDIWISYAGETPSCFNLWKPCRPSLLNRPYFLFNMNQKWGHFVLVIHHCVANDDRSATWDHTYKFLHACMTGFCGEVVQACVTYPPRATL